LSSGNFLRDCGFQFYIYAPKSDPFLRRRWREPIPEETLTHLRYLSAGCRQNGIAFGIGLTPFEIYLNYDEPARVSLRSKVRQINEVDADMLCILFDDMRGDVNGLPQLQADVVSDVCTWSNAESFVVCPTYYSYDSRLTREFGPPPKSYLRELGRSIDPRIDFFWTGEKVISEGYSAQHLEDVASDLGRKPFIWDNYISNDSKIRSNHLFLDPSKGLWTLPPDSAAGIAINPMNQPYLSRIALCGYRNLLRPEVRSRTSFPDVCQNLCGMSVAERLLADVDLFQATGLSKLDAATRSQLLDWYGTETTNPYAQEIVAWLRGDFVFDPQCLTT
jgi:hyaluronoglucosaminidase